MIIKRACVWKKFKQHTPMHESPYVPMCLIVYFKKATLWQTLYDHVRATKTRIYFISLLYLQHSCVCVCNERYSHRATGSVRKRLDILSHSFLCLVNWDMYYPGSACRGTDLPQGRILYIHTHTWSLMLKLPKISYRSTVFEINNKK